MFRVPKAARRILVVLAACVALLPLTSGAASAAGAPVFVNYQSRLCMDDGGSRSNSTPVIQFYCNGLSYQNWQLNWTSRSTFEIQSQDSGKCLDGQLSTSNSTDIVQYSCYGGSTQLWETAEVFPSGGTDEPVFEYINVLSGKCLDAEASNNSGVALVQYTCYGGQTQLWYGE